MITTCEILGDSLQAGFCHFSLGTDTITPDSLYAFRIKHGLFVIGVLVFEAYISFLCHQDTGQINLQEQSVRQIIPGEEGKIPSQTSA